MKLRTPAPSQIGDTIPLVTLPGPVPKIYAGPDRVLRWPHNETSLIGIYSSDNNNAVKVRWRKVSGPDFYTFDNPQSLVTRAGNL